MYIHQPIENTYCSEESAPPLQIFFLNMGTPVGFLKYLFLDLIPRNSGLIGKKKGLHFGILKASPGTYNMQQSLRTHGSHNLEKSLFPPRAPCKRF